MASNVHMTLMVSAAAVLLLLLGGSPALGQSSTGAVPKFVSGSANITLSNDTFTGRTTVIALTSPGNVYELALIQDGFGTSTRFQYCWTEIHSVATGNNLTWREPCSPIKVDGCSLQLTSNGDFVLFVTSDGAQAAAFHTQTDDEGVAGVQLTDNGDLLLVKSDNSTVWQSSDHVECTNQFSGSHRTRLGWLGLACSISLSLIMALAY